MPLPRATSAFPVRLQNTRNAVLWEPRKAPLPSQRKQSAKASALGESLRAKAGAQPRGALLKCQVGAALGEEQRQAGPTGTAAFSRRARRERRSGPEALLPPEPASLPVPPPPAIAAYQPAALQARAAAATTTAASPSCSTTKWRRQEVSSAPAPPRLPHCATRALDRTPRRRESPLFRRTDGDLPRRAAIRISRQRREALWKRESDFLSGTR